jgi:hypothetical protein
MYFLFVSGRRCSRYQFECHSSGECIAIYNACDGIPQCADGSDEAVELDCPDLGNGRVQNFCQFSKSTAWTIWGSNPGREKAFFFSKTSRPALESTKRHIQFEPGFFPGR